MTPWSAEQIALAVSGSVFLVVVAASVHPRLTLSLTSRVVLSVGAGVSLGAAMTGSGSESPANGLLVWWVLISVAAALTWEVVSKLTSLGAHRLASRGRAKRSTPEVPTPVVAASPPLHGTHDALRLVVRALDPAASPAELEELAYTVPEARSAVAAHPATPASVLSWLACHGDDAVVAAIAARRESGDATAIDR